MTFNKLDKPLVSVLMCCYNGERFIRETIESVLCQSYENFEFIIWDDGSTDNTASIIESYHDDRIRYFYHENTGLGKALWLACKEVNGEYIARIDADDICLKDRLKEEVDYMENHPSCSLVSSSAYDIDEHGVVFNWSPPYTNQRLIRKILKKANNIITHPAAMIRVDAYKKTDGYPTVIGYEDYLLWFQLLKTGDFAIIPYPTIKYRYLQNSISHAAGKTPYDTPIISMLRKMSEDEHYSQDDFCILAKLYSLAKRYKKNNDEKPYKGNWKVFSLCSKVIGERFLMRFLCTAKNLYGLIKY